MKHKKKKKPDKKIKMKLLIFIKLKMNTKNYIEAVRSHKIIQNSKKF